LRTIELHFTGRENAELVIESNEAALTISAQDVNRDGATDIVVEQPLTRKRLQVWLNDGHGGFRQVRSEDFPAIDKGRDERLESPPQRTDGPAVCLSRQSRPDLGDPTRHCILGRSFSTRHCCRSLFASIELRAIIQNSSRAPPSI
jgi:hypothetical protein